MNWQDKIARYIDISDPPNFILVDFKRGTEPPEEWHRLFQIRNLLWNLWEVRNLTPAVIEAIAMNENVLKIHAGQDHGKLKTFKRKKKISLSKRFKKLTLKPKKY
jgi:hypothetical protein